MPSVLPSSRRGHLPAFVIVFNCVASEVTVVPLHSYNLAALVSPYPLGFRHGFNCTSSNNFMSYTSVTFMLIFILHMHKYKVKRINIKFIIN